MNIYADSFDPDSQPSTDEAAPSIDAKLPDPMPIEPMPVTPTFGEPPAPAQPAQEPPVAQKKKRGGCCSCLTGCFGIAVVFVVITGGTAWFAVRQLPNWTRDAVVAGIEDSDLRAEDKAAITEQLDRLVADYKSGDVTTNDLVLIGEELTQSPLMGLLMADAATVLYVRTSQLDDEESARARVTLQRLARGAIEGTIERKELDRIFDYISHPNGEGGRALKLELTDEELRVALADAKTVADDAEVADEGFDFDVGAELARVIDDALLSDS